MAIACVYCGGAHETPAGVRACWTDHGSTDLDPASVDVSPSPVEPPLDPPPPADPSRDPPPPAGRQVARAATDLAGPDELARNLVVGTGGGEPPGPWARAGRLVVDTRTITGPEAAIAELRRAASAGQRVVIELTTTFDDPPASSVAAAPYELGATFAFVADELHHLVWSNAVDGRDPTRARWALIERAVALGAGPADSGADVIGPDGAPRWLDGGPVRHHPPIDGVAVVHAAALEHGSLDPPLSNDSAADLAPDQLAAVTHPGGAARIIAPAGSGKTRVLTERARHLLTAWRLPTGAVSLLAFNKLAQTEMEARTTDLPGLQVRTLNAIALAIINGTRPFAPQPATWRTIDEPEVRRLIGQLVPFPKRRNTDPVAPWIEALSAIRLGLRPPERVEREYDGDVDGLREVFPNYRKALAAARVVDFDDQIYRAIELLLADPGARAAAQRTARVLLVDEFQDLTPAHLLLVRLLSAPGGSVFGVGDDDQTIYGYNGADPGWLIGFSSLFPGAGEHPLEVNYRCPAGVVAAADRLLRHNRRRVPKQIRCGSGVEGGLATVEAADPVTATATAVAEALESGAAPGDIAVLTRVNAVLAPVQAALDVGIPLAGGVGREFASRTAVRAVLAWLRLASPATAGPFAADDLAEALRRPSRPLHPRIAEWVAEQRDLDGLGRLAKRVTSERDAERVASFTADIAQLQALVSAGAPTGRVVATLIDELGLSGSVATLDRQRQGMNRSAQGDDLTAIAQLAALHHDPTDFGAWLLSRLDLPRTASGVMLATVHRVKGQEWPHVIVHLADADQYPHRLAVDIEEERRLFHVAITRAIRRAVVVSGARPSPFVAELHHEPPEFTGPEPAPTSRRDRARPTSARGGTRAAAADSDDPLLDRSVVLAAPGLVLVEGSQEWVVETVDASGAMTRRGQSTRRFATGSAVVTAGRQRGRLQPVAGSLSPVSAVVLDELRRLRERLRQGKPAYVVFDDKTLAAIAHTLPSDLDELAGVRGVGPAKLEQYGDAVLGVIAGAR